MTTLNNKLVKTQDSLFAQAEMGANVARTYVTWGGPHYEFANFELPAIQLTITDSYNWTQLDAMKFIVDSIRNRHNPNFKLIIIVGQGPPGWHGMEPGNVYTKTKAGSDQLGQFAANITNYLNAPTEYSQPYAPNRVAAVELYNEPNLASGNGAMNIPFTYYAQMAAYVIAWNYNCVGLTPDGTDLSVPVLLGSLGLTVSSSTWTQGVSPASYISNVIYNVGIILYSMYSQNVASKMLRLFRLSIHPYPTPGSQTLAYPNDWKTNPANHTGDDTPEEAADTVLQKYEAIQAVDPYRKVWITETGASSHKLEEPGQAAFHERIGNYARSRYLNNDKRLEGVVNFGFHDVEPLCDGKLAPYFDNSEFKNFGMISQEDGTTEKAAMNTLRNIYGSTWV